MEYIQIWQGFTEKMAAIVLFYRSAKKLADQQVQELHNRREQQGHNNEYNNMYCTDLKKQKDVCYCRQDLALEDQLKQAVFYRNKQYQWLLVEAYETFEKFISVMFIYYSSIDDSFCEPKYYKNKKPQQSEPNGRTFDWYKENIQIKHIEILNEFRKKFSELVNIEKDNIHDIDLALAITLIEKFRHIIVHNGGKISKKEVFIKKVLETNGLYRNGNPLEKHIIFINAFLGESNLILVQPYHIQDCPIGSYIDRFNLLTNYLIGYARFIYELNCLPPTK